jgi:type IV pilus assembly protein PilW
MNNKGFTLIELLIAMTVGLAIMAAVYGLMVMAQKTSSSLDRKVMSQQDTRAVLNLMAMEIRMASYNPRSEPLIWQGNGTAAMPGIPLCWGAPVSARKGIVIANANTLAFAMDLDRDGQFVSDNEYIRYSYDGVNTLTRATNCGIPPHLLGGNAPFTNVRNAAAVAGGIPMFRYFNKDDVDITATVDNNSSQTNGIPAIRRILVTIASETEDNDSHTGQPKRMVYSTNVIVRNHVLSPPYPMP